MRQIEINGALVAMYKVDDMKAVSIVVNIKAGSWYEEGNNWGKAHLLEHMMFQGTKKFVDGKAMEVFKEENGTWSNAFTSGSKIELMLRMPSESLGAGMTLVEEMLFKMTLDEAKLTKEKKVVVQEYDDKWSKPNARFSKKVDDQYFGENHIYTRDGVGNKEYVLEVTRENLVEYQRKMFVPANMVVTVSGKIDFSEVEENLRRILVGHGELIENTSEKPRPRKEDLVHVEQGLLNETLDAGWTIGGMNEYPFEERLKMGIASYIIGGSPRSLLYARVREELGLAYGIGMGFGFYQSAGWLSVRSSVKAENLESVLLETNKVIADFVEKPIEPDVFARAKKYLVMREKMKFESTMGIAEDLASDLFWERKIVLAEEYERILQGISEDQVRKIVSEAIGGRKPRLSIMRSVT